MSNKQKRPAHRFPQTTLETNLVTDLEEVISEQTTGGNSSEENRQIPAQQTQWPFPLPIGW